MFSSTNIMEEQRPKRDLKDRITYIYKPEAKETLKPIRQRFSRWKQDVKATPYRDLKWLQDDGASKLEAFLYSMESAKMLAIGILNLLEEGMVLLYIGDPSTRTKQDLIKIGLNFLEEATNLYSILYAKFPPVQEALEYVSFKIGSFYSEKN